MYIQKTRNKKHNTIHLYLVEGYRDKNGKAMKRKIESFGELSELQKKDPNILEKLEAEAKRLTELKKQGKFDTALAHIKSFTSDVNSDNERYPILNYGYVILESIYNKLDITSFLKINSKDYTKAKFNIDEILKLLVFSRILSPTSKKETVSKQKRFLKGFDVSLDDCYRTLDVLCKMKLEIEKHLHQRISKEYKRDVSLVFYDVTNYYFESDVTDDLRKSGVSKENRTSPIIQMGLFIDRCGIPIAYHLFPGNTHDAKTLIPALASIKKEFNIGRIILTADKGLNSGSNLGFLSKQGDGYIVSQKIRGSSKEFIKEVLNEDDYIYNHDRTYKIKSFLRERTVIYNDEEIRLKEKCVCFWSKDFDEREKHKRKELMDKIEKMVSNPSLYKASNSFGIKKYLKEKTVNKETGEIEKPKMILEFNKEKYDRDTALDGYYVIITSEIELSDRAVIEKYRGLWKIEESFRVMKSDLEGRPVYVWTESHIQGHFLTCFIALVISRVLEHELEHKYSIAKIQEAIISATCTAIDGRSTFLLHETSQIYQEIEQHYDLEFGSNKVLIEDIRNYFKIIGVKLTNN